MKKIFMTMAAMVIAASASAQVYIGGCAGLSSVKYGKADSFLRSVMSSTRTGRLVLPSVTRV